MHINDAVHRIAYMSNPRVSASLSEDVQLYLDGAVEAGVYTNTGDVIRTALREYFDSHSDVAMESAIQMYTAKQAGNEDDVDLIRAARLANCMPGEMRDELEHRDLLRPEDA